MSERDPHNEPVESTRSIDNEMPLVLDALPGQLGLIETPEMMDLRDEIDRDPLTGERSSELALEYRTCGEAVAEQHNDAKVQIGLIVAMGLLWRDADQPDMALDEFEDALAYAGHMGLVAVAETLYLVIGRMREA
jgi:hypothetical protein